MSSLNVPKKRSIVHVINKAISATQLNKSDAQAINTLPRNDSRESLISSSSYDNSRTEFANNLTRNFSSGTNSNPSLMESPQSEQRERVSISNLSNMPMIVVTKPITNTDSKTINKNTNDSQLEKLRSVIKFGPGPRKCCIKTKHTTIGMSIKQTAEKCYKIIKVEENSLASDSGLQSGDYIIEVTELGPMKNFIYEQFLDVIYKKNSDMSDIEFIVADPFALYRLHASGKFDKDYLPFDSDIPRECVFDAKWVKDQNGCGFSLKRHIISTNPEYNRFEIIGIMANSPAAKSGLENGDNLISISGNNVIDWSYQEVIKLINVCKDAGDFKLVVCNFETWKCVSKAFGSKMLSKSLVNLSIPDVKDNLSMSEIKAEIDRAGQDIHKITNLNKKLCEKIEKLESSLKAKGNCAICLELLGNSTSVIPCGHMFCTDCIQEMAFNSKVAQMECPTCRKLFILNSCYPVFFS